MTDINMTDTNKDTAAFMTDSHKLNAVLNELRYMNKKQDRMNTELTQIRETIVGGLGDCPGVLERLRTLESAEGRRKWTIRAVMAAAISALINSIWR